jgi:hypothetical protein
VPTFLPGLDLSRSFYWDAVRPLLDAAYPGLPHAAALIGPGSEILGFDTTLSTDHDWCARVFLFLLEDAAAHRQPIAELLSQQLSPTFDGFPASLPQPPTDPRLRAMTLPTHGSTRHRVIPITVHDFAHILLGVSPREPLRPLDWLTLSSQVLGELTAGEVFHDGTGELTALRERFAWYPPDIWRYLLAAGWQRIGQEEHLMPRAGMAGDELGSSIIGSRLTRDLVRLAFLLERRYAPYAKWLGAAFARLPLGADLGPFLWRAQQASTWRDRQAALIPAYEALARRQNSARLCRPVPATVSGFFDRPFNVIHGGEIASALVEQIADPELRALANRRLIGNVDLWSDNTDVGGLPRENLRHLYD